MTSDNMIAALLRERDGYQRRGLDDRVAQVDAQLAFLGYEPDAEPGPEVPQGRSATDPEMQTADPGDGKRGRGRPRMPRDSDGNIVRD